MQNRSLKILFLTMFFILGGHIQSSQSAISALMEKVPYTFEKLVASYGFTAFYLWAPDASGKPFIDIDFTSNNKQFINALNKVLSTQEVYLNITITPATATSGAIVNVQGYDNAANLITNLSYSAIEGTPGQVLGQGYIRYSYAKNPQDSDLLGIPVDGPDLTASQISNLWIKISRSKLGMVRRALELTRAVYQSLNVSYSSLKSLTLIQLQQLIPVLIQNQLGIYSVITAPNTLPYGWNFNLNQMSSGDGYAFVNDPWNGITTKFNPKTQAGVATTKINVKSIESTINCEGQSCDGKCSMVLLGFDQNNNYISDIIAKKPHTFGLFMYDINGNILSGFPVRFSAKNYVGLANYTLESKPTSPATFTLGGFGITSPQTLTYPFLLDVKWI